MTADRQVILALDVGSVRIGLALASSLARIAAPYKTIPHDAAVLDTLKAICTNEQVTHLVVGLPRGLSGQSTAQTTRVEQFVNELAAALALPVSLQDEAVTSVQAEAELERRGRPYQRGDIDMLAATYILEDYLA